MRMRLALPALLVPLIIPWSLATTIEAAPKAKPKPKPKAPVAEPTPAPDPQPAPPAAPAAGDKGSGHGPDSGKPAGGGAGGGGGAGAGGGSAEPAKDPSEQEPKPTKANEPDIDSLRQEYLSLRDELFKSRARANAVASSLYSTRIQIKLTYTTGRYYNPAKAVIRLDGASVYENASGGIAGDDGIRFEGFVAPGKHLITFRVEAAGKDDDSFTSVTENQISVKAVAGKDLIVSAKAKDAGDIAYEWKRKERGSYGLGLDVSVKTIARPGEAPAKGGKK